MSAAQRRATLAAVRRRPPSFAERLGRDLDRIERDLQALIDGSTIENIDPNDPWSSVAFIGFPTWGWGPSDDAHTRKRMQLIREYDAWWARFRTLFAGITPELLDDLEGADEFARSWITRKDGDHSIPSSIARAKLVAAEKLAPLRRGLEVLGAQGDTGIRLVPDTSALMDRPDPATYAAVAGTKTLAIDLLPAVLAELDSLKDGGRNQQQRDRARVALRNIRALRDRGSLTQGVKATRGITVVARTREPDFARLPGWLDRAAGDDRVLAGVLEVQADHPGATVYLVANDLNIANKAEVLGLPTLEAAPDVAEDAVS